MCFSFCEGGGHPPARSEGARTQSVRLPTRISAQTRRLNATWWRSVGESGEHVPPPTSCCNDSAWLSGCFRTGKERDNIHGWHYPRVRTHTHSHSHARTHTHQMDAFLTGPGPSDRSIIDVKRARKDENSLRFQALQIKYTDFYFPPFNWISFDLTV